MVILYLLEKILSIAFPLCALGRVDDGDAFGLEQVANAVGLCEVLGLFGGGALGEQALDADEFLTVQRIPLAKAVRMVLENEIRDGKTQAAVLKVDALLRAGALEA